MPGNDNAVVELLANSEELVGDAWERMRAQIAALPEFETIYKKVEPHVAAMRLHLSDAEAEEVLALYHRTVTDGRYIKEFVTDPGSVAEKLHLPLSPESETAIKRVGSLPALQQQGVVAVAPIVVIVVIVVVVVIVFGPRGPSKSEMVVDSSGVTKL